MLMVVGLQIETELNVDESTFLDKSKFFYMNLRTEVTP